jgi:hypothetical protein
MKKVLVILIVVILVGIVSVKKFISGGPDLSRFEHLKTPQISFRSDEKMIEVTATGDPNVTAGKAIGLLFKAFFKIKRNTNGLKFTAPRARWPLMPETPRENWIGVFGLPVPDAVLHIPQISSKDGLTVKLTTWKYGDVAEVLHVGPYSTEDRTVKKLHDFIKEEGYGIAGPHEEEYLKSAGMFFKGNPEEYYTIIRYQVKKMDSTGLSMQ